MAVKDIKVYAGDTEGWVSIGDVSHIPVSSEDGTVVLDSPSANTFTISTGGAERLRITDDAATFSVDIQTSRIVGSAAPDTDAAIQLGANATISTGALYIDVGNPAKNITIGDNKAGVAGGDGVFIMSRTHDLALSSDEIRFNTDWTGGATEPTWVMTTDSGFVGNNQANYIKCGSVAGIADNDASIELGTELLTTNHTPTQPNSIATKQTVDDKIQVMTTAEYNALATKNPTTLYCLTD